ncbi:MAG: acetylxylan esterase [Ferruginibacter sp.]|nr:acetylxylan esterase [Ferruginibacter sp.]
MKRSLKFIFLCLLVTTTVSVAQVPLAVKVIVAPDHPDWTYQVGEKVKFSVTVLRNGNPVQNARIVYEIGPEKMQFTKFDSTTLSNGKLEIDGGSLKTPGFLRCTVTAAVDGFKYRALATAGFNPTDIKPTVTLPADFDQFWNKAKDELARIPLDARMRLLPERCTGNVNVYEVNLQNIGNSRLYGIVCIPKKEGRYPAVMLPPGAGVRSYYGDIALAERGVIAFTIGIHGIPVTMDENVYKNLGDGALRGYNSFNLDDKNNYYYKRVYLGCVRANDFITSLPQYDGEHLGVTGGSQGGALSIVTAALDNRVKILAAYYPALCDLTGFLNNRAGGWPGFFYYKYGTTANVKDKTETIGYYDVVNFAKSVKVDGMYAWGYNDETCPPTSMYSAYNSIAAPKKLILSLETGHFVYPEITIKMNDWLLQQLKNK